MSDYDLDSMSVKEMAELLQQIEEYEKYNKIAYFKPYPYQLKMFNAGTQHKARFACLANRCGKTFAGAMEMSYHLTGLYPEWWEGKRFDRPIKAWAIGITTDSTRKVMQLELMGTISAKEANAIGSGSIPRACIGLDTMERDGDIIRVVRVMHVSGEESILEFRSTQSGTSVLMGTSQDFIWLDEESPHNSLEIFTQCSTRTATTNGLVLITATPENGLSALIQMFYDRKGLFIFHAGWDEVPHLSEETKKALLETYPEWEVEMRCKGIPSKGSGAIFQVEDSFISAPELRPMAHWPIIAGIDFGRSRDPSTIVYAAKDPSTEIVYLFNEEYLDKDRSPENMARVILSSEYPEIPVIGPHDTNAVTTDGGNETRGVIMREHGVNLLGTTFSNPQELQNQITNIHKKHMGKEGGLAWMAHMMKQGKLKVCANLSYFFKEKQSYFYITKGGKTVPKDGDDHIIDAARLAVLSIDRYGVAVQDCSTGFQSYNDSGSNGLSFSYDDDGHY